MISKRDVLEVYELECGWCWETIRVTADDLEDADVATDETLTDAFHSQGLKAAQDDDQIGYACATCIKNGNLEVIGGTDAEGEIFIKKP